MAETKQIDRSHLKLARLPKVDGGDWLRTALLMMIEQTGKDAEAIRTRNFRYFSDHHKLSDDSWYEIEREFSVWIWSKRFAQVLEAFNLGDPKTITKAREKLLEDAGLL